MALPKINAPTYDLKLYSDGRTVKFRPFLVKEQKLLLMAAEEGKPADIMNALGTIVKNCTFDQVDPEQVPLFEIENIFLRLREKSIGEVAEFKLKCLNEECNHPHQIGVDLSTITLQGEGVPSNKIKITDNITITMRFPTMKMLENMGSMTSVEDNMKFLSEAMESIQHGENIIDARTTSKEELQEFIDSMTQDQFLRIRDYFTSMPRLSKDVEYKCVKCGKDNVRSISGLQNFLA